MEEINLWHGNIYSMKWTQTEVKVEKVALCIWSIYLFAESNYLTIASELTGFSANGKMCLFKWAACFEAEYSKVHQIEYFK